jgi:citrate synthase
VSSTANLGLEGVVAFETEIAEPDKEGSALRYRGVDIEELAGNVPFERVWGLVVNESLDSGLPLPAPDVVPVSHSGDARADLQATLPTLAPQWGLKQLVDTDADQARHDLAQLSSATLSIVAQSLRGDEPPVPAPEVEQGKTAAEQFLIRWRGQADEKEAKALDVYWVSAAEHGMNASTFTARIAASTGADCAACLASAVGSLSGPLHGGAPARVLPMLDAVAASGDPERYVQ